MPWIDHDLALALRAVRKSPGSTLAALLVIALGVGVNVAMLQLAQGVLLRPLPYPDSDRLALLSLSVADGSDFGVAADELEEWRARLRTTESLAAYLTHDATLRGVGEARRVRVAEVTPSFFDVLGLAPVRGAIDSRAGAVLLSERALATGGGATAPEQPTVSSDPLGRWLGHGVDLDGVDHTVTGVLPSLFAFPSESITLWRPVASAAALGVPEAGRKRSNTAPSRILVRLQPGVTMAQFDADVRRVIGEIWHLRGSEPVGVQPILTPLNDALVGNVRPVLVACWAAALLVLLVTCGNVALLLLGRGIERRGETAVRQALGASRWRLARGPLVESLTLALVGSLAGLWLAQLATRWIVSRGAGVIPRLGESTLESGPSGGWTLALFVTSVAAVALLSGLAPAWGRAREWSAPHLSVRTSGAGDRGGRRLLGWVVVCQIAASVVLLSGALLLLRTIDQLLDQELGFDPAGVVTVALFRDSPPARATEPESSSDTGATSPDRWAHELLDRVRSLPGVEAAGLGSSLPPVDPPFQIFVRMVLDEGEKSQRMSVVSATPGFFEALGVPVRAGRPFAALDQDDQRAALVLSETAARFYTPPGRAPVDRELGVPLPPVARFDGKPTIVGVVSDLRYAGLDQPAAAALFVPWHARPVDAAHLVVRAPGAGPALLGELRTLLRQLDPEMPVPAIQSLEATMLGSIQGRRWRLVPAIGFAILALGVALLGLYAVLDRMVEERRHELAIRRALGATRKRLAAGMLARAGSLSVVGILLGLVATLALGRGLQSLLYGVAPHDPATLSTVALLVLCTGLLVAWRPAHRAASTAPAEVLRGD